MIEEYYFNCFFSTIAQILEYKKKDYSYLSIGMWDFKYLCSDEKEIGEKIDSYRRKSNMLFDYYGIEMNPYIVNNLSTINEMIKKYSIVVRADLFNCPWNNSYKKYHFDHCFLLKEIKNDMFICDDPFLKRKDIICRKKEFTEIADSYIIVETKNSKPTHKYILDELAIDSQFFFHNINNLQNFIIDCRKNFNIDNEIAMYGGDIYAIPVFDRVNTILLNKKSYTVMLKKISEKIDKKIIDIYHMAQKCVEEWETLKLVILKQCVIKQTDKKKIINILENIYNFELIFRKEYYEYCQKYSIEMKRMNENE